MTAAIPLSDLTDDLLLAEVERLVADERRATAALIRALIELDTRRLYLREGCSSLFTYCTQVLHLAEGAAYNRIEAARAVRRFPEILDALEEGAITLTAVRLVAPHLTADNRADVLAAARGKSKREVEALVAALHSKPAVPSVIRKLPEPRRDSLLPVEESAGPATVTIPAPPRAAVTPLAPERFKVQLTISRDTHDRLRRAQDLLRHVIPNGDLAAIFDRALTMLLEELERRRCAATPDPRPSRGGSSRSRHIPAAVRRAVWKRDEGRCAFVATQGRCTERGFLEFHHVEPYAAGGAATLENVQLRCRAHKAYEASLCFGNGAPWLAREEPAQWLVSGRERANSFRNERTQY